ncbi:phosphatase [Variovorax boronicumulans]|uniref:Phosphatase n=1 Tax=Variovorax boronicumulans TaxID=436515 RepID=A0A250DTH0_9BURK|nr:PhoX family phosphatase [Variovorax boronicumulans]ATA57381.1 phosphatase [Variovorax boronicumulans]
MTANTRTDAHGVDLDDVGTNDSPNPSFIDLVASRLSRRHLFGLGVGTAGTALLQACGGGSGGGGAAFPIIPPAPAPAPAPAPSPTPLKLGFNPVAKSLDDVVTVPAGYTASVLYRLGDPIAAGVAAYKNDGTDDPATYDRRAGDHHDGMTFFGVNATNKWDPANATRGLLVMNHEAITPLFLHPDGQTIVGGVRTVADEVKREFYLHGVSVVEVNKTGSSWSYKQDSSFNRRVHTLTDMQFSGPAAKTDYLKTKYSTDGSKTRGTLNNCANGTTPWGTYLTCEENWAGYFRRIKGTDDSKRSAKELASFSRYGVASTGRELWATVTPDTVDGQYGRWNTEVLGASATDDYRNGHNTYGWVVEIDPFNPTSTPKKRTALGRFGHEGACLGPVVVGKPLVWYMGDDSRNEYIYKFVSTKNWDAADIGGGMAAGDKYMDDGRLYVARFDEDGTGVWLELKLGVNNITSNYDKYAFADAADVVTNARLAADAAGATKMDRPEWTAVNPKTGDVYVTLTNTNAASRPIGKTSASNPRYYDDRTTANAPQLGNPNGHIVRFADENADPTSLRFKWDVYLFAARSTASADVNLSQLTADNDLSSPDGMWFSHAAPGLLWLQTDDGAYTDVTNCMLLAALPGKVGDGGAKVITNVDAATSTTRTQNTFVGKAPGTEGLRRFLVGPKDCELTGIAESGDGRALFVNIQHPGEGSKKDETPISHWPDGGSSRPRSATVVITKNDGGLIGL